MTTSVRDAHSLQPPRSLPWPFTGREEELDLVRRSSAAGRPGLVVTGPAGCGRTRLAAQALRDTDCARVAGTPETRGTPFAAFAHLLPEDVTLHRAVHLMTGVRLLLVDDAHLLDDASAALVHQLAVRGRTRLLVLAADGAAAPAAVSRLWTGELLPRLALEPLPRDETAQLLAAGAGGPLEPLTADRLHRLAHGDLRLLRDLLDALRARRLLTRDPDTGTWAWRGPVPVTPALRDRAATVLARPCPDERETLDRLAFAEPLPLPVDALDLRVLERLETDGLIHADDDTTVRLAHPLHGPVLRAAAGRLRARRLTGTRPPHGPALDAEAAALARRIDRVDVRAAHAPVGEWLVAQGLPVPAGYAAVRARFARLRGQLREAAAWAREGLRNAPHDPACHHELALSTAQSGQALAHAGQTSAQSGKTSAQRGQAPGRCGQVPAHSGQAPGRSGQMPDRSGHVPARPRQTSAQSGQTSAQPGQVPGRCGQVPAHSGQAPGRSGQAPANSGQAPAQSGQTPAQSGQAPARDGGTASVACWFAAARGDLDAALRELDTSDPYAAYDAVRLGAPGLAARLPLPDGVFARHADALARRDGPALDRVAEELEERGFLLFAAEAHAQAVTAHRDAGAARTARTRAAALARRCQGARTPALSGLVLGELTARQRQIVTLAAAGLSNRQIAERLTLSVRTVGNHLYGAYTRLGASDRAALPWLVEPPTAQPA
ncbi:LuxR C-terminal-related transcriptional regulator [Streptomyces sp. A012304]|uniref:LuxR C-terminal-related transcriptional regulator n=1 Tax=Streptomyces sp. A012304 TaxID=375446 RepID=UPI00222FB032|nr:LuxR C-terminal-related transcriptional regulator [Streptomyces sp. A012304]GKQ38811.1 hypothetical protein ALMP_53400 [Streptomyces sp. A012304]